MAEETKGGKSKMQTGQTLFLLCLYLNLIVDFSLNLHFPVVFSIIYIYIY